IISLPIFKTAIRFTCLTVIIRPINRCTHSSRIKCWSVRRGFFLRFFVTTKHRWLVVNMRIVSKFIRFTEIHLATTLISTDRKSTRLNSSHVSISYAVFCLKKKKKDNTAKRGAKANNAASVLSALGCMQQSKEWRREQSTNAQAQPPYDDILPARSRAKSAV